MNETNIDQLPNLINDIISAESDEELALAVSDINACLYQEQYGLLLEAVPPEKRLVIWQSFSFDAQLSAFVQLKSETRNWLLSILPDEECFELLKELDVEEILEIAEVLPDRFLSYAIKELDESQRNFFQQAQQYSDDKLGHWLDYNYVRISEKLKVSSAKKLLEKGINDYTNEFYTVDKTGRLTGVVSINQLMSCNEGAVLSDITQRECLTLNANEDLLDASEAMILSGKMSLPVCDDNGMFVGRFTIASAYETKEEFTTEQQNKAGGLNKEEDLFSSVGKSAQNRGIWLGINLLTAFLASAVIGLFEITLQQVVLLAVLMPVVASMGGISGSQTLTLIVRGLALGQITESNLKALLIKELKVGMVNGVLWAFIIGAIVYWWFDDLGISLVLAIAILGNLIVAAASGVVIPALLNRFNIDPALSGSVLLTTVTDVIGFLIFLGLGSLFLL